jgi:AmmeMemoRadiSam system protein A
MANGKAFVKVEPVLATFIFLPRMTRISRNFRANSWNSRLIFHGKETSARFSQRLFTQESLLDSDAAQMYDGVMDGKLTSAEKQFLLKLARQALEAAVRGQPLPPLDPAALTPLLRAAGASFVTLTVGGDLRGCIGALELYQPLADDVREHAVAAALDDYRFPPVKEAELAEIAIEVSRLTVPAPLDYAGPDDLLEKLRPGVDGVILRDGPRRATFLPQVWEKIPDKAEFLSNLCCKMGAAPDTWQRKHLEALVYQVEEFHE